LYIMTLRWYTQACNRSYKKSDSSKDKLAMGSIGKHRNHTLNKEIDAILRAEILPA